MGMNQKKYFENLSKCQKELLDYVSDSIFVIDRQNHALIYMNQQAAAHVKRQDAVYCYEAFWERETDCRNCFLHKMGTQQSSFHLEEYYIAADDSWHRIDCHSSSWDGIDVLVLVVLDITAPKKNADNYYRMYRQLTEDRPDTLGSFHMNLTQNICGEIRSNYEIVLKLRQSKTVDELLANVAGLIINTEIQRDFRGQISRKGFLQQFSRGRTFISTQFPMVFSDGSPHWVYAAVHLLQNPMTTDVEGIAYAEDMTESKRNEEIVNLVTREKFDYLGILNLAHRTFTYHRIKENFLVGSMHKQYDSDEHREDVRRLFVDDSEWEEFHRNTDLSRIAKELSKNSTYTVLYFCRDGERESLRQLQYTWLHRDLQEVLVIQSDVTAAYEREQERLHELRQALERAEQASRAKTEFVSRISHDIRTPLSAIRNMTDFALQDIKEPNKLKDDLEKIRTSNLFLMSLINDILDISRIDSGQIQLEPEPYPYEEYISHLQNMFGPLCAEKGLRLIIEPRRKTGVMVADKVRINQITLNLFANAIKYTPAGGTIIYRSLSRDLPENKLLYSFEIEDTGIGMSEAFQKTMFMPFSQEYDNPARPQGITGTGLGLSIVKNVVDLMGGELSVRSQQGLGTCIRCSIVVPDAMRDPAYCQTVPKKFVPVPKKLQGCVLLVEDNEINREIALRILEGIGLTVEMAVNGQEAVQAFAASKPGRYQAILMDLQMPILNGYEAARQIRAMDRADAGTIPILAMTADAFQEAIDRCRAAGMDGHIAKPLDPQVMQQILAGYVEADL